MHAHITMTPCSYFFLSNMPLFPSFFLSFYISRFPFHPSIFQLCFCLFASFCLSVVPSFILPAIFPFHLFLLPFPQLTLCLSFFLCYFLSFHHSLFYNFHFIPIFFLPYLPYLSFLPASSCSDMLTSMLFQSIHTQGVPHATITH